LYLAPPKKDGQSGLQIVFKTRNFGIAKLLIKQDADINLANENNPALQVRFQTLKWSSINYSRIKRQTYNTRFAANFCRPPANILRAEEG